MSCRVLHLFIMSDDACVLKAVDRKAWFMILLHPFKVSDQNARSVHQD